MVWNAFSTAMDRILAAAGAPAVLVPALSGGLDSVVLLHLAARWRKEAGVPAAFLVAHLNHGLRGDAADADMEFCRRYAAGLGFEFRAEKVDAAAVARENRLGVEEAGRLLRYRYFLELAAGRPVLALTGHHADDQAETILLHLRRGAHRRGLSGMRELSTLPLPPDGHIAVARPLLRIGRERLHAYALEHGLDWREDHTNLDSSYRRNRIRHRVIPMLENIMPGFRERLLEKAERWAREEEGLVREGRDLVERLAEREAGGRFFRLAPEAFESQERLLYAFRQVVEGELGCRLPHGAVLSRLARLAEAGRLGEALALPGQLVVRKEPDGLFFHFPGRAADGAVPEAVLPDPPFDIVANGMAITAEWLPTSGTIPPADRDDPEVEWLNPAGIRWPLCLRPPFPGERFRPLGAPGSRKIQDMLVDFKTPRRKRGMARVLADHAGALWLWPYRLANRVRLAGAATKVLRVRMTALAREGE